MLCLCLCFQRRCTHGFGLCEQLDQDKPHARQCDAGSLHGISDGAAGLGAQKLTRRRACVGGAFSFDADAGCWSTASAVPPRLRRREPPAAAAPPF